MRRNHNHFAVRGLVRAFRRRLVAAKRKRRSKLRSAPLNAALPGRQAGHAAKAVTSHRTPTSSRCSRIVIHRSTARRSRRQIGARPVPGRSGLAVWRASGNPGVSLQAGVLRAGTTRAPRASRPARVEPIAAQRVSQRTQSSMNLRRVAQAVTGTTVSYVSGGTTFPSLVLSARFCSS